MPARKTTDTLTPEQLRAALDYSPATGILTWRHRRDVLPRVNTRYAGKAAGCPDGQYGYISIRLNDRLYQAHRLAWLWMTGAWPEDMIDHRDMNPANNAWNNLRPATKAENMRNQGTPVHNKSGLKGASFDRRTQKWVAQIQVDGKNNYLGRFDTPDAAHTAYREAAAKLHGEFANFG